MNFNIRSLDYWQMFVALPMVAGAVYGLYAMICVFFRGSSIAGSVPEAVGSFVGGLISGFVATTIIEMAAVAAAIPLLLIWRCIRWIRTRGQPQTSGS